MFAPLVRKGRQVLQDPVLRRWMVRRALRLEPPPPAFAAGRPPYLDSLDVGHDTPIWRGPHGDDPGPPAAPVDLPLAGATVRVEPDDPGALFSRSFPDLETELSAHRFAWLPLAGRSADPAWVGALWSCWTDRFGDGAGGWPWHAYTAAERAINILDFAALHGLPGDEARTLSALARHAELIADSLEYSGDHYTSNHLSNDGRGLLRIGAALGLTRAARLGARIMVAEAGRIFGRAGVLREGSTHYHLLLTRNYTDAWLAADAAGLPETAALEAIAIRALRAAPALRLGGGLPLIGDISPDCPPDFLAPLVQAGSAGGWPELLDDGRKAAFAALQRKAAGLPPADIAADGWHRAGGHDWEILAFASADGWTPMPGHGHQDLGSFEMHAGGRALIVDPGRGSYADAAYAAAAVHSGLTVDGHDPAPANRPYYSDAWRARIVPARPAIQNTPEGLRLTHSGYRRLRGVGETVREWRFAPDRVEISERVDGYGSRRIRRQFCTPHPVSRDGQAAVIDADGTRFRLSAGTALDFRDVVCWRAYGEGRRGTLIVAEERQPLPYSAGTTIERLG